MKMKISYHTTAIILLVYCHGIAMGLNCSSRCCYYYHSIPQNVTGASCNPQGREIQLECKVYTPQDPYTTLSAKWFRGPTNIAAREQGVRVLPQSNKYTLFYTMNTTAVNESGSIFNGLYLDAFNLRIGNFNSSVDDGSYWCQLAVNNTGLRPSDIGSLAFGALPVEDKCSLRRSDLIHVEVPPVCAVYLENTTENNPVTVTDAAHPETSDGVMEPDSTRQTSRSTTASNSITNGSSAPTTATTKEVVEPKGASPSSLYIAIAVVLVAIALAVFALLIIVFLVRKRRKRDRQSDKHKQKDFANVPKKSLNVYDWPVDLSSPPKMSKEELKSELSASLPPIPPVTPPTEAVATSPTTQAPLSPPPDVPSPVAPPPVTPPPDKSPPQPPQASPPAQPTPRDYETCYARPKATPKVSTTSLPAEGTTKYQGLIVSHANAPAYNIPSAQKSTSEDVSKQGSLHQYQGLIVSEVSAPVYNVPSTQIAKPVNGEANSITNTGGEGKSSTTHQYQGLIASEVSTPTYNVPTALSKHPGPTVSQAVTTSGYNVSGAVLKIETGEEGKSTTNEYQGLIDGQVDAPHKYNVPTVHEDKSANKNTSTIGSGQYQGLIESEVNAVPAYNVLNVRKT